VIRIALPRHLRVLAGTTGELTVDLDGPATQQGVLDALEAAYPALRGTIRDPATGQRRPFIRFFASEEDLSHQAPDAPLPEPVAAGREPLLVVGAMAGG
jgi:sulfur-carrier protein